MKAIIEFEKVENELKTLKVIAIQNGYKTSKQGLTELAIKIASDTIKFLDKESISNVLNLKC